MSLTRFLGATSREALRRVREALGADAMIVSNREVDGGVEIVATNDDAAAAAALPPPPRRATQEPGATPATDRPAPDADFLPQFRVPGMPPRMRAPAPEHDLGRSAEPMRPVPGLAGVGAFTAPNGAQRAGPMRVAAAPPADAPANAVAVPVAPPGLEKLPPQSVSGTQEPSPDAAVFPAVSLSTVAGARPASAVGRAVPVAAAAAEAPPDVQAQSRPVGLPPGAVEPPALLRAIDALQDTLGERIDGLLWRQQAPESPVGLAVYRTLLGAGFSAALARALATRVPAGATRDDALAWVRHELARRLPVSNDESAMFAAGGVYALIGPTGVGKTTTTAKLAARWVMAHGANRVAMLTTDGFRVGAHEQLRIYGRILGVPVLAVNDSEQLQHALRELKDKHVVLIDTVGMSQRDRNLAEQAALLCAAGRPVRRLLLLNAASHGDTLDEVAHAYRQDETGGLSGCILTKIDEAKQLGAALDIAIRHRLPIHYVSDGQRVPENVSQPNAPALVSRALSSAASALFAPTEADLAAVWNQAGQALDARGEDPVRAARRQRHLQAALSGLQAGSDAAAGHVLTDLAADRTTVLSRQVWRHFHDAAPTDALEDLMLAQVREHATQAAGRKVLAWHGRARTASVTGTQRAVPGTVLWSEQGAPLAAPVRHLLTANGVVATFDSEALPPASGAESATARAAWLSTSLDGLGLVHGFDGFSVAQAQGWQSRGWAWLARCSAPQRVQWEDSRISVGALAKLLGYAPAGEVWVGDTACTCWVGGAAVDVSAPGQPPLSLRLIAMRCVDADGRLHAQAWALTNVTVDEADTVRVGRWLSQVEASRRAEPWLQTAIDACVRSDADLPALRRALLAGAQLGLSAWHLSQGQSAAARSLGLPAGNGPRARRQVLDHVVRVFGALDMHEDVPAAC